MQQPITSLLIAASRKAVKFFHRDFLELGMLQRSSKGNYDFCNKAYVKAQDLLRNELQKYTSALFFPEDKFKLDNSEEMVLLINPLDGFSNLEKSLPFFAVSITCLKKINQILTTICTVINFPAFDEIYYVEKGRGVWSENNTSNNSRLRVSGCSSVDNFLIATDDLNINPVFLKNARVFGCHCYGMLLLAAGKIDAVYFSSLNYTLKAAFDLIIREAGGAIINKDEMFVATNCELSKKFEHLLAEKTSI
ncbi:inositol monophosphatase family protein [Candidatus Tisiphia endosymbiont of Nemotelus uliginosus]|uniref:inositol monophosphatase family protein n=1 Tax=Candidatus Tisiphia endosymbiont of Nemotelus uliginosus TaxID=3077926 RepID=UPI0035C8F656